MNFMGVGVMSVGPWPSSEHSGKQGSIGGFMLNSLFTFLLIRI